MTNDDERNRLGHTYKEISLNGRSTGITGDYADYRGSQITIHNSYRLPYEIDEETFDRWVTAQAATPGQIQVIRIPPLRLNTDSQTLRTDQAQHRGRRQVEKAAGETSRPRISPQQGHISAQALASAYSWSDAGNQSLESSSRSSSGSRIPRLSTTSTGRRGSSLSRFSKLSDTPTSSIPSSATDLTSLSAVVLEEDTSQKLEQQAMEPDINKEVPWVGHQFGLDSTKLSTIYTTPVTRTEADNKPLPTIPETKRKACDVSLHEEFHHLKFAMEAFEKRLQAREATCRRLCELEDDNRMCGHNSP